MYNVGIAYILWLVSGFGALGLHRFYLGKIPTGLLWMFTGGLGTVGAIYDFSLFQDRYKKPIFVLKFNGNCTAWKADPYLNKPGAMLNQYIPGKPKKKAVNAQYSVLHERTGAW